MVGPLLTCRCFLRQWKFSYDLKKSIKTKACITIKLKCHDVYRLDETERQLIIEAMVTIMEESGNCVEFVNKTTQPNFIFITQQLSG